MIRFRGAVYKEARVQDLVRMVLRYLWDWIYRAGLTKQQILAWFGSLLHCDISSGRQAGIIPTELRDTIARLMANQSWNCGDFMEALTDELEKPIPGYRWKAGEHGQHVLVKVRSEIGERAVVQGKRFAGKIFLGAWWETVTPSGPANRRLQNAIKKNGGSVFWNEKRAGGGRKYGAFVVADRAAAEQIANTLCRLADAVTSEGDGDYRLSAIGMDGIAEHRDVRPSDQVWVGCIRSIKFNWEYSLPDLLNGRIEEFKRAAPYNKLIKQLREM